MHTRQGRLIIYYASEMHEGLYEIRAQSHYQDAYARTRIKVYKGFSIQFDPPTHHPKTSISLGLFKISKETQPKKKNCKNDPKISLFKNIDNFVAPSIRTLNPRLAEKFKKIRKIFLRKVYEQRLRKCIRITFFQILVLTVITLSWLSFERGLS